MRNFKLSLKSDTDQRPGKTAKIQKIANNAILAATEIRTLREEVRCLRSQVDRSVLSADLDRNGKLLPDGAGGSDIKQAIGIMDKSISFSIAGRWYS
jgi:hypothetical protein